MMVMFMIYILQRGDDEHDGGVYDVKLTAW